MYISNEDFIVAEGKQEGNAFELAKEVYLKHCKGSRKTYVSLEFYDEKKEKRYSCEKVYDDENFDEKLQSFKNANGNFEYKVVDVFWDDNDGDDENGRPIIRTGYDRHIYIESIISDKEMVEIKEAELKKLKQNVDNFNSIIYLRNKGRSYIVKGNTVEINNQKFELSDEFIRSLEYIKSFTEYIYEIKKYSLKYEIDTVLNFINDGFDEDDEDKFEPIDYDDFVSNLELDEEEYDLDSMYDLYVKYLKELKETGHIMLDVSDFRKAKEIAFSEKEFSSQYFGKQYERDKKEYVIACVKKNVEAGTINNKEFLCFDCVKFSSINVIIPDIENWI